MITERPERENGATVPTVHDVTAARRVLASYFVDFEADARLVEQLLAQQPELVAQAGAWGWDDTEVRGQLAGAVSKALLGRTWPIYGEGDVIDAFSRDLQAAYARWVQGNESD